MLFTVRDQLLINKAADAVYAKANVTMVEPKPAACASCDKASELALPANTLQPLLPQRQKPPSRVVFFVSCTSVHGLFKAGRGHALFLP